MKSVAKKRLNLAEQYVQCIVLIFIMRVTQLRQADLNLLVVFSVLAEERNVSRIRCNARLTAGWLSSNRLAARDAFRSSASTENTTRRFKSA